MGIAWLGHVEKIGGVDEYFVDRPGMAREQIVAAFPPHWNSRRYGMDFNRTELVKALILEAYQEAQNGFERELRNVRGFWYERLLYTLRTVMQDDGPQKSINHAINEAWGELVESGAITYAGMSIRSAKSRQYHVAVNPDSPYPRCVVLVEKEDFFEPLRDIADTYEIAFVASGGQNSRCAAMEYVDQLERMGVSLGQPFTVLSFCDFDPEGWRIPEVFIEHLRVKIDAPIHLVRLGVLKEQIGQSVIQYQATAYEPDAKTDAAQKGVETKYENFAEETGGIYMPDTGEPARIEIDMYEAAQIRERILEGLAQHIDGFPYQVRELKDSIRGLYDSAWRAFVAGIYDDVEVTYEPYFDAIDAERQELEQAKAHRAPHVRQRMRELHRELAACEARVREATADLDAQQGVLRSLRGKLTEDKQNEANKLIEWVQDVGCDGPDEVIARIESNGGWQHWAEEHLDHTVTGEWLADDARHHRRFSWALQYDDRRWLTNWLAQRIQNTTVEAFAEGPDKTPEEMIREALGE